MFCFKRFCDALAIVVLLSLSSAYAQDGLQAGYTGRGVAKIIEGDIASARYGALVDAQGKAVMAAVLDQLSIDEMARYFLTIKNVFIDHPGIYLQRFKLAEENALFDVYRVTIQGAVQQELLKHDLESMGILGPQRRKLSVLLMIAEKGLETSEETYWWSADKHVAVSRYGVQQKLERFFIKKGAHVVEPSEVPEPVLPLETAHGVDPDVDAVCRLADRLGARVVVLGKTDLQKVLGEKFSSLESIQCDMQARVIDVKDRSLLVQTATHALGTHIDEASAARDAIEKACGHLSDQIIDKIYLQMKNMHALTFRIHFDKSLAEADVDLWLDGLKTTVPEVEVVEVKQEPDVEFWMITLNSSIERGAVLQRIFEQEGGAFTTEVGSVTDDVIELRVSRREPL